MGCLSNRLLSGADQNARMVGSAVNDAGIPVCLGERPRPLTFNGARLYGHFFENMVHCTASSGSSRSISVLARDVRVRRHAGRRVLWNGRKRQTGFRPCHNYANAETIRLIRCRAYVTHGDSSYSYCCAGAHRRRRGHGASASRRAAGIPNER